MDYTAVTEATGNRITREALSMLYTRYAYAAEIGAGRDVLEVACGSGQGLGYLARKAKKVVGGDYTGGLVEEAQRHYQGRIPLLRLDAHAIPFRASSFDVVILYEAIYYLAQPDRFLEECRRVLRDKGTLLICTVNKEWPDFNPSPFSTRYFSSRELAGLLEKHQFDVELCGAFPVARESAKDRMLSVLKRAAVSLHLIPKTMRGKEILKRIFLGRLVALPDELQEGIADYRLPVPILSGVNSSQYKVLYAVCRTG
jgi:ubiquinone/menaquinone biosynthesis C-methylase UbiE